MLELPSVSLSCHKDVTMVVLFLRKSLEGSDSGEQRGQSETGGPCHGAPMVSYLAQTYKTKVQSTLDSILSSKVPSQGYKDAELAFAL